MKLRKLITAASALVLLALATGCEKTKSYSELLKDEEQACNWYLAQHEVEVKIPEDSVFKVGKDAPYYKMDGSGDVYMRVIKDGDRSKKPKNGDRVYFSFMRQNLLDLKNGRIPEDYWVGNAEDMSSGSTSFILGETFLTSSTQYGNGIQLPVTYLGYYSEVEIVVKSLEGFEDEQYVHTKSDCIPFVYKVRYFPAQY